MVTWSTSIIFFIIVFVAFATASQDSPPTCSDAQSGACTTEASELLSAISEHTSSDHLAYVQKKAAKVQEHRRAEEPNSEPDWYLHSASAEQNIESHAWAVPLDWSYSPSPADLPVTPYGPNMWGMAAGSEACAEQGTQSPINLVFASAVDRAHEVATDLGLQTVGNCATPGYELNERTAEVEYGTHDCSTALKATWLGRDYFLAKFHYRSPSEHTLDGGYFPMEVHHVHRDADGVALVIAVMVRVAYEQAGVDTGPAAFLLDVLSKMPSPGDDKSNNRFEETKPSDKWNPYSDFIPDLSTGFYTYLGSLTTPPCTSGTTWIIAPKPVTIPSSTLKLYRELINANPINQLSPYGNITGEGEDALPPWNPASHMTTWSYLLKCNNRPIQPLTGVNNYARFLYKIGNTSQVTD